MINQVNNVDQEPTQKDPREKRIWQILFGILGITILFAIIVFFILPRENQEEPSVTPTPEITATPDALENLYGTYTYQEQLENTTITYTLQIAKNTRTVYEIIGEKTVSYQADLRLENGNLTLDHIVLCSDEEDCTQMDGEITFTQKEPNYFTTSWQLDHEITLQKAE